MSACKQHADNPVKGYSACPGCEVERIKAENAELRLQCGGMEMDIQELKAENEALRKALTECADSLHGEMLQKFGGQQPDDMHPVTRREYDRDMSELAAYRAAMSKEVER